MQLENYALGRWTKGEGEGQALYNSINGELVATATTKGLDFAEMMDYARKIGGTALRKMTFQESPHEHARSTDDTDAIPQRPGFRRPPGWRDL